MGHHITGITGVTAVTLTRKAMNPEAKVILLKSKTGRQTPPANPGEITMPAPAMDATLLKSIAGFDDDTKNYLVGLSDEKIVEFIGLDPAARTEAVSKAKKDVTIPASLIKGMVMMSKDDQAHVAHLPDDKVMEFMNMTPDQKAAAVKKAKEPAPGDPEVLALRKSVEQLTLSAAAYQADKKKSRIQGVADKDYPNVPTAFDQLSAIDDLPEAVQAPILKGLKTQETLAVQMTKSYGVSPVVEAGTAQAELDGVVAEVAKTKKLEKSAAFLQVATDPAHADLILRVREEEGIA